MSTLPSLIPQIGQNAFMRSWSAYASDSMHGFGVRGSVGPLQALGVPRALELSKRQRAGRSWEAGSSQRPSIVAAGWHFRTALKEHCISYTQTLTIVAGENKTLYSLPTSPLHIMLGAGILFLCFYVNARFFVCGKLYSITSIWKDSVSQNCLWFEQITLPLPAPETL